MRNSINNINKEVYRSNLTTIEREEYSLTMEVVCRRRLMSLYAKVETEDVNEEVEMEDFEMTTYSVAVKIEADGEEKYHTELLTGITYISAIKAINILTRRTLTLEQAEVSLENMPENNKGCYEKLVIVMAKMLEDEHLPNRSDFDRVKISGIRAHIKKKMKELIPATRKPNSVFLIDRPINNNAVVA